MRPARWPWVALGGFFLMAIFGTVGIVVNDESLAEQVPFIIAFSMFGVVGAMVLSRAPGNRIGGLLMYGSFATAIGFVSGELTTYLFDRGTTEGPVVVAAALISSIGWVLGILPVLFLLPLLFPDGRPPSPRWRPVIWAVVAFTVLLGVSGVFSEDVLTGSSDRAEIQNPLYVRTLTETLVISDAVINFALIGSSAPRSPRWSSDSGDHEASNASRSNGCS